MQYDEAKSKFLQQLKSMGKLPNTIKNYKNDLSIFAQFLDQNKEGEKQLSLEKMNPLLAQHFGDYLTSLYPKSNSKRRRLQVVRMFYDFLVKEKVVSDNPIKTIPSFPRVLELPKPCPYLDIIKTWKYLEKEINPFSSKDENPFKKALALRNGLVFILIYTSGLTISQIKKLTKESLSLGKNPRIIVTPNKRDPYSLPLHKGFVDYYEDYQKELRKLQLGHTNHLFLAANRHTFMNRPLSDRGVDLIFEHIRSRLNIKMTPKNLRQACITSWFNRGESLTNIKKWMGVAPNHDLSSYEQIKDELVYQANFLSRT